MKKYWVVLAACQTLTAWAVSPASDFESSPSTLENSHWEIGVHTGYAFPIGNKSQSIWASHQLFLYSDPDVPGEDEFGENGLPAPDPNGQSFVEGNMRPAFWAGGHAYYRLTSWIGAGLEGSVMMQRSLTKLQTGAFDVPIYETEYKAHGEQIAASVRIGHWMGNFRPYGMVGAGPYFLTERVTADLIDPDDPDHSPLIAAERSDTYMSAIWGGGIDVNFFNEGSVGFALQYQRVFKPGNNLQFMIPSLRFDYHFG